MISKEIVISWFKGLSGDDRIDLMCLLVDYCLPSELRFIGTYLEAAAQKDYYGFRTYESAANNPTDLSYMYLLEDPIIRRRLCLYIALLHSSNRQAAAVLFGILNDFHPSGLLDEEVLTELSLLYTLTSNHPAFSFHQKHVLRSKLKVLRMQSVTTTSDLGETVSDCSTGSSPFLLDAESQSFSPAESPVSSNSSGLDTNEDEELEVVEPAKSEEKKEELPAIPENPPKVYVKEIKVLNIQKKGETKQKHESKKKEDYEYVIEVTWSDDANDKIHRSYEEMFDFQCKLRKMYPNKVDENGQPWKLPFLPGRIRIFNKAEHKGERTPIPDIGDYARLFASLPKFVRGCEHVLNFFHNNEKSKNREKKSKSAKKEEKAKAKQDSLKNNKQNDTKSNDNKPSETTSTEIEKNPSSGEKGVSDSTTKQTVENSEQIIDKEKQKELDNIIETLKQEDSGKSLDWSEIVDYNDNYITSSMNGDIAAEDKLTDLDTVVSVTNYMEGKNGIIKLNSLQKSTSSVSPPVGPVITTTQASNTNLYPINSTFLYTSQNNNLNFSNPGLQNSHSSLNASSSITNTFMPLHPFVVRSSISAPVATPIESSPMFPSYSHSFNRRSSTGSWTFRTPACSLTVQDWLKNLRLHKYSETFKGKTFNEILKLSDKEFEKLGMTIGARRKLRVNLEILRKRGCFSSDGLRVLDVLPVSPSSYHAPVISTSSSFNGNGYPCGGYCSDTDFVRGMSESDSASECGSDILSESYPQAKYNGFVPFKTTTPNGCRLSCYNCGSLGHVGGQCMAPNMEKRLNCYRLKFDGVHT
ncbi:zinc finger CCHC domain-containing protein 2-like isoform X2 [Actinia tenebrosa]|uniref:Zinc finger CCHC domain-containing protein 2-like isoform X2 n=1 Tax=Actinia tenebrosa TaxID=6105 RepID=A0A6P8IKE7_ACTTE|nr:zinc finger CCHC domain-containing protein 2-like isoform X2 [Actinia tenebrosa]